MMSAVRAGVTGVGVTTGVANAGDLSAAGASVVIDGLPALQADLRDRGLLG